jgi:hypothetical protein
MVEPANTRSLSLVYRYLKSVFVGLLASVVALCLAAITIWIVFRFGALDFFSFPPEGSGIGATSYNVTPWVWAIIVVGFLLGFVWEFRRAVRE